MNLGKDKFGKIGGGENISTFFFNFADILVGRGRKGWGGCVKGDGMALR